MPQGERDTLQQVYYPQALQKVRDAENSLNVPTNERLHVQYMDGLWNVGDLKEFLPSVSRVIFDDHNCVGEAVAAELGSHGKSNYDAKQGDYTYYMCFLDNRLSGGDTPRVVQKFSLTIDGDCKICDQFEVNKPDNQAFYRQWWIAQQRMYEQTN